MALGLTLSGCGYNARDAHLARRDAVVSAAPGDGSIAVVRLDSWPHDEPTANALAGVTLTEATPIDASR
ncbi:MAG: hypothetical protein AAGK04_11275 [Planctomycetota bacterium]